MRIGGSAFRLPASSRFRRRSGPVGRRFLRGGRLRPSRSRAAAVGSARPFSGPRLGGSSARPCAARERGRFLPASACNRVRPACANRRLGISPPRLFAFSSSLRSCRPSLSPRRTASSKLLSPLAAGCALRGPGPQLSGPPVLSRGFASEEAPPGRAPQGRPRRNFYRPSPPAHPSRSRAAAVGYARPFSVPRLGGSSSRPCAARGRGRFLPTSACNRVRPACADRRLGTSPPCLFAFSSSLRSCRPSAAGKATADGIRPARVCPPPPGVEPRTHPARRA